MVAKGIPDVQLDDILSRVTEIDILQRYFNVKKVPTLICSPLRQDKKPSFGLCCPDGYKIYFKDFATGESGSIFTLLMKYWNLDYKSMLYKIWSDIQGIPCNTMQLNTNPYKPPTYKRRDVKLECKIREWRDYDIEYWASYGVTLEWLKYADVWPISHKIMVINNVQYTFAADKLAYAFVERKEGKVTIKIYQPMNKNGYKWSNKHDRSVISLWTKVPEYGDKICICSSLKDALCLSCNTYIPAISIQGEAYKMSNTAIMELKRRYKQVYILLDNDDAGKKDSIKLAEATGFTNIILPEFEGGKDISDAYKCLGKDKFLDMVLPLFDAV